MSVSVSIISVQFLIPSWLREMWGDGIMIVSGLMGLGVSKLWVRYLDRSGQTANIHNLLGTSERDIT